MPNLSRRTPRAYVSPYRAEGARLAYSMARDVGDSAVMLAALRVRWCCVLCCTAEATDLAIVDAFAECARELMEA